MTRRLRVGMAAALLVGGLLVMLIGGGAVAAGWYTARTWESSVEGEQAARALAAPTPRFLDDAAPTPTLRPTSTPRPATPRPATPTPLQATPALALRAADAGERRGGHLAATAPAGDDDRAQDASPPDAERDVPAPTATPEPRAPTDAIALAESEFRFLDPPEPGAQAQLTVAIRNASTLPTGPLRLTLSTRWLSGWRVLAAEPPVLDDRVEPGNRRIFEFPGLDPESEGAFELHLVTTDDLVDAPELVLSQSDGAEIDRTQPETVAPRPNPGPARTVEIPRLKLRAAVVQTTWEPPAFVVGQLKGTANLGEGNTVLLGHLNGLAGDVFARLDELEPGDEVIAVSRGLEYRYVVSETMLLPGDDSIPIQPTDEPRLTLLTCAGEWNPVEHDYSHRLWVVAEPAELAEASLKGERPGPLTRQLGLAPPLTLLPPANLGPSPKEAVVTATPEDAPEPESTIELLAPDDGAHVGERVTVAGRLTDAADASQPVWLAVRADVEGSRWYLYAEPLLPDADGEWSASLELGGAPGIRHTIVAAQVDPATNARLQRQARQRPGEPLSILPDAFEQGARITVVRR
ncbi:MAG: sortase [Chloroflexi bacterium]|nr:sortase [Chloroflexota bacterium]